MEDGLHFLSLKMNNKISMFILVMSFYVSRGDANDFIELASCCEIAS